MANEERQKLVAEAKSLGLEFPPNIPTDKLQKLVDDFYDNDAKGDIVEEAPEEEVIEDIEEEVEAAKPKVVAKKESKDMIHRRKVNEAKKQAMKKRRIVLTSNDKRDNDYMTTAYLGFENQHFGLDRIVPLDIPVELEECLIEVARTTYITLHRDEIKDGKRTGNKIPVRTRKFNVSFE